jgi:hypothetical protein
MSSPCISVLQLHRSMGFGSVKTGWLMARKVRTALIEKNRDKLGGIVEVNETFFGGKKHSTRTSASRASARQARPR